ncbi:hypothetical protein K2173_016157 [Erythroxylum novogranatense]|uniref:Uncharacterized protein n=1 Tax=Erythroxylum novogranatense TaxID=1862640 RepID=A0AAV8SG48_9ROSI|nr:hypothetical protein K2173_016157 [Erythroxylum novogranatense]
MGRTPCCDKANVRRGPWSPEEDATLKEYLKKHGTGGNWIALPGKAGLRRCGKSCRLRWLNYLRPDIKHGGFTEEEDKIICTLYGSIGSRWSVIASKLPGRTDNDVKNHWNTKLKKKLAVGHIGGNRSNRETHYSDNYQVKTINNISDTDLAQISSSTPKFGDCDNGNSPLFATDSSTLPPLMEVISYQQHYEPQRLTWDQSQCPPNLGTSSGCNSCSPSSLHEVSGISVTSCPALQNKHASWSSSGTMVQEDEIALEFGFESFDDLVS